MTMASTATSPLPSARRQRGWSDGECVARLRPPHVRRRRRQTLFMSRRRASSNTSRISSRLAPPPSLADVVTTTLLLLLLPSFIRANDAPFYKGERHIPTYTLRRAQTECLYAPFTATESATLSVFVPSVTNGEAELTCAATFEGPISTLEQTMNAGAAQRLGSSLMEGMKKHWPNVQRSVAEPVKKGSPAKLIKFDEVVDFEHVHEEEDEDEEGEEDEEDEEEIRDEESVEEHEMKRAAKLEEEQGRRNHHRNRRNQGRERRMDERKKRREEKFKRRQERQKQKQREREGKDGGGGKEDKRMEEEILKEAVRRNEKEDGRKKEEQNVKENGGGRGEKDKQTQKEEQVKADDGEDGREHTEHTSDIMKRRRERIEKNKKEVERKEKELKNEREEQKTEGAAEVQEDKETRKTRERIKRNQEKLARAQQQAGGRRLTEQDDEADSDDDGEEDIDGDHRRLQFVPGRGGGGRGGQLTGGRFGKRPRDFAKDEDEELYEGEAFERTFTIPVDGWYRFCVRPTPNLPPQAQLIVEMDLRSSSKLGGVDPDTGHVYTHERRLELNEEADLELLLDEAAERNGIQEEDLESTTELIMEMNDLVSEIRDEQANHKHRLQHHRTLDAHSKSKLAKTAAMETALYVLITAYQVRTVRNWFKGGQLLG